MEIITDASLEGSGCRMLEKSQFLFEDRVATSDEALYVDEHKWLREIDTVRKLLPDMMRSYPLSYLQKLFIPCHMNWNMTRG